MKAIKPLMCSLAMTSLGLSQVHAVELLTVNTNGTDTKVSLGGYAKVDVRHVEGDIAYQDYWIANYPAGRPIETSHTGFNVKESRVNLKVQHGEVTGFVEMDFYGGGGNEVVSNSSNPRLRHYFIKYKNWMVGQNWTTFMPLHALPETLDFGGPHVGEVFARQTQVRYTHGSWQFAIENPETNGDGDVGAAANGVGVTGQQADQDESTPDFVARYNHKADWGMLSAGALVRKIDQGGLDETGVAFNIAGKINTFGKDDIRFQVSAGEAGRYVAAGLTSDIVVDPSDDRQKVESTTAFTLAYRHFWSEGMRSTVFYGGAKTDELERERSHWGINLMTSVSANLDVGGEFGNYAIDDKGIEAIDSNYLQFSAIYKF
ncbi:hypothetical protein DXX93_17915 [Thalassotalea euphylliae]|uniref:Porin n=1 Tax=Thalassotalea euphylliae TaxID=1655234 RepID=A0A3E0TUK5_9GAMM|nr:DcaP family trimeric outer membrane transporter [Thalassotalea euphylliae]REL28258.1 hypothetical protein DXX93_17915 [Thalassotalea euphylliae]